MERSLANILLQEQESQLGDPEPFPSLAAPDFFRTLRQALKAGTEARRCLYINKSSLPSRCPFLAKHSLSIEDQARVVVQLTGNFTEQVWTGFLGHRDIGQERYWQCPNKQTRNYKDKSSLCFFTQETSTNISLFFPTLFSSCRVEVDNQQQAGKDDQINRKRRVKFKFAWQKLHRSAVGRQRHSYSELN